MALFYLLTLYCFIRGLEGGARRWHSLCVLACLAGALCKEVIATAPVVVLLYDIVFVSGGIGSALKRRPLLYGALAATWVPLAWLLMGVSDRGVGYGLGVPWLDYALTECKAVLTYARLSLWPHPLIFDRGWDLANGPAAIAPALGLVALAAVVIRGLRRYPWAGFLGTAFFIILAPTSSVIPVIQQPIAENRAYLPSALVVIFVVLLTFRLAGRKAALAICGGLIATGMLGTLSRNRDYRSEIALWTDTVQKCPANARGHYNLGVALDYAGRVEEAITQYRTALQVAPNYPDAHNNLGNALAEHGNISEAFPHLETAVRLRPRYADARYNLGNAFLNTGRLPEAAEQYLAALDVNANQPKARNNLGIVHLQAGRLQEAMQEFERAIALNPHFADPHSNRAVALARLGRVSEAIEECEAALRINPNYENARNNLASLKATKTQSERTP